MFNFTEYTNDIATRLKDIRHSESNPRWFRVSNITALEELLASLGNADGVIMLVEDNLDGKYGWNEAGLVTDDEFYTFHIIKHLSNEGFSEREAWIKEAKSIVKKVLSKMFRDQNTSLENNTRNDLRDLDRGRITYQSVGPLAGNFHGMMCSFVITEKSGIVYSDDDWDPEVQS